MEFGHIVKLSLKDVLKGEATDFTPWLAANLNIISEKMGMDLELESTESSVGDFSVDILARDLNTNKRVVIENQYGATDHKHLGQLLTYSFGPQVGAAVWIFESIRNEHKMAIDMLNQSLGERLKIYAIEVSVIKIDNSNPAISFAVVCEPSESDEMVSGDVSETKEKYRAYFQSLIDDLRNNHKFTNARSGQPQSWYNFASENSKVYKYGMSFSRSRARVEIYLDCGNGLKNDAIFKKLLADKDKIEHELGRKVEWEDLPNRRACRVASYRDGSIDDDSAALEEIKNWSIENLIKFKEVFPKFINEALKAVALESVDAPAITEK